MTQMGAGMSNPLDATKDRIQDRIGEIVAIFAEQMALQYKTVLIEQVKEEAQEEKWAYELLEAGPPDWDLQTGMLMKRGANIFAKTRWQERHFVVKNAAENFRVYYYRGQGLLKIPSDHIDGASYRPVKLDAEDEATKKLGPPTPFAWKMEPFDDKLRQWYLCAGTEEDRAKWMDTMKAACFKARAPCDPDPVIAKAFKRAFRETRWQCGEYGYYNYYFNEPQTLGALIFRVIESEILSRDVYPKIPSQVKTKVKAMVDKSAGATCTTAASSSWNGARTAAQNAKDHVNELARSSLGPLFAAEKALSDKLVSKITDIATPVLERCGNDILKPIATVVLPPILQVYVQAIDGLATTMQPLVKDLSNAAKENFDDKLHTLCREARMTIDYSWSGPMKEPCATIRKFRDNDVVKTINKHVTGYNLYRLTNSLESGIRTVLHNAVFTFETNCETVKAEGAEEEPKAMNPADSLLDIAPKVAKDLETVFSEQLTDIFTSFIEDTVDESIVGPGHAACKPLDSEVPDPVKELIVLANLAERVITDTVSSAISTIINAGLPSQLPFHQKAIDVLKYNPSSADESSS